MSTLRWSVVAAVALLVAGCSTTGAPTAEPTQILIPATITDTPSPVPPTTTPEALPRPGDLVLTPESENTEAATEDAPSALDAELEADPVAAELAALAQRRIAQELNLPTRRVQIVEVTAYKWTDSSLGCPVAGETYTPGEVDGYRIVLEVADQQYFFHTDVDRALPCDAANEQLPPTETP